MTVIHCPRCRQRLKVTDKHATGPIGCPRCHSSFARNETGKIAAMPENLDRSIDAVSSEPITRATHSVNLEELIDMTAMVDIVFFLLIFFLVTSMSAVQSSARLPQPETHSDNPAAKQPLSGESRESHSIVVTIARDDSIDLDGVPYRMIEDLTLRIRQLRNAGGDDLTVLIIGHGDATHGTTAAVFDAAYEAGINRLQLTVVEDRDSDRNLVSSGL